MSLGIEPPKGVLLFGPPGTGKTLCARAVANRTDACFIRVIGSELVQKYVGEVSQRHTQKKNTVPCVKPDVTPKCLYAIIKCCSSLSLQFFLCFQGARMVRELFEMARTKKACLIFFDEIDAIGGRHLVHNHVLLCLLFYTALLKSCLGHTQKKLLDACNFPGKLHPAPLTSSD